MKVTLETGIYNEKRYGKPYIGALDPQTGRVTRWGAWIGTPGNSGFLEIEAEPGTAVIKGQKDFRGNNGDGSFGVIQPDGSIEWMSKANAIRAARQPAPAADPLADLRAERERLIARIAEIDAALAN